MNHYAIAAELYNARLDGRLLAPLSDSQNLNIDDAYLIQKALFQQRLLRGERLIGYKIGYTSKAMRKQMQVTEPNFAPLTDAMTVISGSVVGSGLLQPRVEPEVLVELSEGLGSTPSLGEIRAAVGTARAALEIVDSIFMNYRFRIEDNTADGSSAALVVIGSPLPSDQDLATVEVELVAGDKQIAKATGAAALGHPLEAVRWLAKAAAMRGHPLQAGQLILTGGLTMAVSLEPGQTVRARFSTTEDVVVSRQTY